MPIRVAVGEMPNLLHEIILSSLSSHADLEVVGVEDTESASSSLYDGLDVLMLSSDGIQLTGEHEQLLWGQPRLRILVIDRRGHQAALWELQPHGIALHEVSAESLIDTIRDTCSWSRSTELLDTSTRH